MENGLALNPIDRFLADAENRLRGRLTPEKVAATLRQARAHMTQRAEELAANGLEPAVALASAAAALGTPRQWAGDVLQAENYNPFIVPANQVSIVSFALLMIVVPMGAMTIKGMTGGDTQSAIAALIAGVLVTLLAAFAAPVGALISGRCDVKTLLGIVGVAVVLGFISVGQAAPPLITISSDGASLGDLQTNQDQRGLLQLGVDTYGVADAPANPPAAFPAKLKVGTEYLAPTENFTSHKNSHRFSDISNSSGNNGMDLVSTQEEAARRWRAYGAARLAACDQERVKIQKDLIHRSSEPTPSFSWSYAWKAALVVAFQGGWWLGWCLLLSHIGRNAQESNARRRIQQQIAQDAGGQWA